MSAPPPIVLSRLDVERLEALLETATRRDSDAAARLRSEIERADIVEPALLPGDVVSMNSTADCVDAASGQHHTLTLVYPKDADADAGRVSVLAPVGSALLGLRVGAGIDWPGQGGQTHHLRVTAIHYQPEAAGDLHR